MRIRLISDSMAASSTKHCLEIFERDTQCASSTHFGSTMDEVINKSLNYYKSILGNLEAELKKLGVFNDKHSNS